MQDETGIYKNLLQETAHRAGLKLPVYTAIRAGPAYAPVFTCTVDLNGMTFAGEPAKTKKQAQKCAAMAAWFALKKCMCIIKCSQFHSIWRKVGTNTKYGIVHCEFLSKREIYNKKVNLLYMTLTFIPTHMNPDHSLKSRKKY